MTDRDDKQAPETESGQWRRLLVDSVVGVTAGFALSWIITPMDCAVMESMAHQQTTVRSSLTVAARQIVSKPHRYMRLPQFKYVLGTYSSTYLMKNYVDTVCKTSQCSAEQTAMYKFWLGQI